MTVQTRTVPVPLGNRVILVKDEAPTETAGGIHLPTDSREKPLLAHVVAISDEVETKGRIHVGHDVVYASFAGTEFLIEGIEVIVVDADDIMIVLEEVEVVAKEAPPAKELEELLASEGGVNPPQLKIAPEDGGVLTGANLNALEIEDAVDQAMDRAAAASEVTDDN